MEFSNPGADFLEGIAQPQGAESLSEGVAPPHTADDNNPDFAVPGRVDVDAMSDSDFVAHINAIKDGTVKTKQEPKKEEVSTQKTDEPYRSFGTEEEFNDFMRKAIGERLKNSREDKKKYDSIARKAQSIYGGNEEDAIDRMFEDIEKRAADEKGVSLADYQEDISIRQDAMAFRDARDEEVRRETEINEQIRRWETESEQLKSVIPDFDFEKAMENAVFRSAVLERQMSLASAYIFATKTSLANQQPKRQEVYEVGNTRTRGGQTRGIDPMEMSDEDFAKYIAGRRNS